MPKRIFATAVLLLLASLGCSKPAPPPAPIRPVTEQDLKKLVPPPYDAQKGFAASDKLYKELTEGTAAPGSGAKPSASTTPSPDMTPGLPLALGRPVASLQELSAVIQKAGYTPHSNDAGGVPYFMVTSDPAVAKLGFPDGLKIIYLLSEDKKSFTFAAVVRELRESEGNDVSQATSNAPLAPTLVSTLQGVNPMAKTSSFVATEMSVMNNGKVSIVMPFLLFSTTRRNENMDPGTVISVVGDIVRVLGTTQGIWK
jgi:hypothetical protein